LRSSHNRCLSLDMRNVIKTPATQNKKRHFSLCWKRSDARVHFISRRWLIKRAKALWKSQKDNDGAAQVAGATQKLAVATIFLIHN
jgi:hypothetical protein